MWRSEPRDCAGSGRLLACPEHERYRRRCGRQRGTPTRWIRRWHGQRGELDVEGGRDLRRAHGLPPKNLCAHQVLAIGQRRANIERQRKSPLRGLAWISTERKRLTTVGDDVPDRRCFGRVAGRCVRNICHLAALRCGRRTQPFGASDLSAVIRGNAERSQSRP